MTKPEENKDKMALLCPHCNEEIPKARLFTEYVQEVSLSTDKDNDLCLGKLGLFVTQIEANKIECPHCDKKIGNIIL